MYSVTDSPAYSPANYDSCSSLYVAYLITHSLFHSFTHSHSLCLFHSNTQLLTVSFTYSLNSYVVQSLSCSFRHSESHKISLYLAPKNSVIS